LERRVSVSIIIILFLTSSAFTIGALYLNTDQSNTIYEFEWAVGIGDSFNFEIIVTGGSYTDWNDPGSPPPFSEFNESIIHAEVIYLPRNTTSLDNATILSEIILPIKFQCSFANGSPIPEPVNRKMTELLSWSLLPIGRSELLNACFYENRFINQFSYLNQKICKTDLDESMLNLTISIQKDWLHAIGEWWKCSANRTSGLSQWMAYSVYSFSCVGIGYRSILTLNLIERE